MTGQNPWIGKTLGDCRIEKFIGSGAMSEVYLAYYNKLGISVALKIMNFVHESEEKSKKFQRRFQQELKFVSTLNHPNIVKVYGGGEDHGYWYMIMEYVPGMTLMKLIETQGHLSIQETLFFLQEIVSALKVSHEQGIIHRDIKPGNILITESGHCKLTDFGLAKGVNSNSSISQKGNIVGTIFYMSPEQTMGSKNIDYRADYYSLGVTLFQMVTGKLPFPGRTPLQVIQQHLVSKVPSAKELNPEVTDGIEYLIFKMMEKKPENRFSSAKSILKAIDKCYNSQPTFLEKYFSKLILFVAIILIAIILGILGTVIYNYSNNQPKNNIQITINNTQNSIPKMPQQDKTYNKCKNNRYENKQPATISEQKDIPVQTTKLTLVITPNKIQLHPHDHYIFKVQAFDDWKNKVDFSPDWIPYGGQINEDGEFIAGDKEGKYILLVRDKKTLALAQATIEIIDPKHPKGWFGENMPKGMIKNNVLGEYIWEKDHSIMMYIPEGEFFSGNNQGENDEKPANSIYLDGYYLDKFELTYKQYQLYCEENKIELHIQKNQEDYPVVNISWTEANNYAKWVGKRLPSEAEWEKAARGGDQIPNWNEQTLVPLITNTIPKRSYPWGNQLPHNNNNGFFCNYVAYDDSSKCDEDGYAKTAPVGSFLAGQSPYGIQDMAGNVCEWCQDSYDSNFYKTRSNRNPISQNVGNEFVVRGGSWHHYSQSCCTYRRSSQPNERFEYTGVRFAK